MQIIKKLIFKANSYRKSAILPINPQIFSKLVKETSEYPKFIPFVSSSTLVKQISPTQYYTALTISYPAVSSISYTSHVNISKDNNKEIIRSVCKQYPLKQLQSIWEIEGKSDKDVHVQYNVNFEFGNLFYQLLSSKFMDVVGQKMWNTFVTQASIRQQQMNQNQNQFNKSSESINANSVAANNLQDFLSKHSQIRKQYQNNPLFSKKVESLSQKLIGTEKYEQKMLFEIGLILANSNN